jgi:dTDP-glucose pyrophosphorylase
VNWREIEVAPAMTLAVAIERIDRAGMQAALVVDDDHRLVGMVTDGDVRRALLRGCALDTPIRDVMNPNPRTLRIGTSREDVLAFMRRHRFHHVPLVDEEGELAGLELLDELIGATEVPNPVVLMAGGLGTRLQPLTQDCPKPLLPVGGTPILEHILKAFVDEGFRRFYLAVNYKAEMIAEHFGSGDRWGVQIDYLREEMPLGTAGALTLLPARPQHPLVVMNGDLMTRASFASILDFHARHGGLATMAVREYDLQIPYGVVTVDNGEVVGVEEAKAGRIVRIDEKPMQRFFVNAGIYVLSPEALDHLPAKTPFDMPALFDHLRKVGPTMAFPLREFWMDIGEHDALQVANEHASAPTDPSVRRR